MTGFRRIVGASPILGREGQKNTEIRKDGDISCSVGGAYGSLLVELSYATWSLTDTSWVAASNSSTAANENS